MWKQFCVRYYTRKKLERLKGIRNDNRVEEHIGLSLSLKPPDDIGMKIISCKP